jgi:hypothetical protein
MAETLFGELEKITFSQKKNNKRLFEIKGAFVSKFYDEFWQK